MGRSLLVAMQLANAMLPAADLAHTPQWWRLVDEPFGRRQGARFPIGELSRGDSPPPP